MRRVVSGGSFLLAGAIAALAFSAGCDGGSAASAPALLFDAGTADEGDAGLPTNDTDAGMIDPVDAGVDPVDAGVDPVDAGVDPVDAGPADAGSADAGAPPTVTDPRQAGPFPIVGTVSGKVVRSGRETPFTALLPNKTPAPLVLFLPGFQLKADAYAPLHEYVASQGFVVVRADPPAGLLQGADHLEMTSDAIAVLDEVTSATGLLAGKVDAARVGLFGHSLGGKVATMVAARDARVKALLGIDPVNGYPPAIPFVTQGGYDAQHPDIVPAQVETLTIPVGFIGETTNGAPPFPGGTACAPLDQNFETFYDAAVRSPWAGLWDVQGANHSQFVDNCNNVCRFSCTGGSASTDAVLALTRTVSAGFFVRHLQGRPDMDAFLVGDQGPAGATIRFKP